MNQSIGIIGVGNLGSSLINGILKSEKIKPEQIFLFVRNLEKNNSWKSKNINICDDINSFLDNSSIIIIAVKPYQLHDILVSLKDKLDNKKHLIISTISGVSLNDYKIISEDIPVFRIMPNTAADVSSSISCFSYNEKDKKHIHKIEEILSMFGEYLEIDESLMDAATVLGSCGLAYIFRFIRAMVQGGVQIGFDNKTAEKLVLQTMIGAVNLLKENLSHPEQEIDKVATPKGCTIIGLNEMEHQGFSSSLIKGIELSYKSLKKIKD